MSPSRKRGIFFGILFVSILAAFAAWSWPFRGNGDLTVSGTIEAYEVLVGSRIGGRVEKIFVREGDLVKPGQVILELERSELEAALAQAKAGAEIAQAALDELLAGTRPEEIARARAAALAAKENLEALKTWPRREELDQAKADLEAVRAELAYAESNFRRTQELFEKGTASASERDSAKSLLDMGTAKAASLREKLRVFETGSRPEEIRAAEARLRESEAVLDLAVKGPRKEEIDRARAALEEARARARLAGTQLDEMTVKAPRDSLVEVFDTRPGDLAGPHQALATLIEPDLWVRVYVPESKIGLLRIGEDVTVRVDSFPGKAFPGSIERVQRRAEFTPRNVQTPEERVNQVFGVRVRLPNPEGLLRAGMAADVTIPGAAARD